MREVGLLAVAAGPGSFTGVRVGLTTVKAWAELFGLEVVGVSRLEVMARQVAESRGFVAASFDAQRGQVFGALYRNDGKGSWRLIEQEMVIAPDEFVKWAGRSSDGEAIRWSTLDPKLFEGAPSWRERAAKGETLLQCGDGLATGVAALGEERAKQGRFTDSLLLDANYVRRSDAEIFWKDPASHGK
jgi:tRNA threonylcarbamoyladenosine biosynthesis protein TsaB